MLNWNKVKIIKIESITDKTWIFWAEVQDVEGFKFTPGQFITFDLPIHEKRNKRLRSYSIASAPDGTNQIELIIGRVPDGLASEFFFNKEKCQVGTIIDFRGPLGVFTVPKDLNKHHIFVCTGTGIAPFRSMVKQIINSNLPYKSIDLVFGARNMEDILYKDELEKLAAENENFKYHVCLSREEYKGYKGYVHSKYHDIAKVKNQEEVAFMFCGWRDMIDQARKELSELNYTKKQIHFELYG